MRVLWTLLVVPLLVVGAARPAAAQFEEAIPVGEDADAVDIAVTTDGDGWRAAERDGLTFGDVGS